MRHTCALQVAEGVCANKSRPDARRQEVGPTVRVECTATGVLRASGGVPREVLGLWQPTHQASDLAYLEPFSSADLGLGLRRCRRLDARELRPAQL